jgi:hypothetical protein
MDYMKFATANRTALEGGPGYCVYCLEEVMRVDRWIAGGTALCPHCSIDAVVPACHVPSAPQQRLEQLLAWRRWGFDTPLPALPSWCEGLRHFAQDERV